MKFERVFSLSGTIPVEDQIIWTTRTVHMTDKDGQVVFHQDDVEVPESWSQIATDILAQKYFRKVGLHGRTTRVEENNVPQWLWRSTQLDEFTDDYPIGETSAKQVFHRLAGAWTYWGWKGGYFKIPFRDDLGSYEREEENSARIFYDETYLMLARQMAAPNSPQWFNTGLHWAYGIEGGDSGQWICDNGTPEQIHDSYSRPQVHACFIQPVRDDLVGPGGIMDLVVREARLFKHGSGSGTNFSSLRSKGESLAGGGTSSGLMSFLRVGDRAAGAIKSGGTTRRAAKMVCLDSDHPEIEDFVNWKVQQECIAQELVDTGLYTQDEAIEIVSGQNSNNSVRITDYFLECVDKDHEWNLINRTDGKVAKTIQARLLWDQICYAAWKCADPGVQFHDTINTWHTCKADGEINASNPCSEYMFLDNTACNLASLNLVGFLDDDGFDSIRFEHAVRIWTVILDISVSMASFPSAEIALGTYKYRTLGLGYANLGALLMRQGIAYDSDEGRQFATDITYYMNKVAYYTSSELARELGSFPRWEENKKCAQEVHKMHGLISLESCRNAQVTLLAPTGTIALIMDCDTTGIEPAFSLKTHKKLAGGGYIDAYNRSAAIAMQKLGYNGEELKLEHLPIFATAVGENSLSPEAHVKMVAAVQPYLSGAVSKTVNMPNSATIQDVDAIYRLAHKLGLKSIAIYPDGCKLAQPLTAQTDELKEETINWDQQEEIFVSEKNKEAARRYHELWNQKERGTRESLPSRRKGYTQKFKINGQSLYLRTGEYDDGTLGEIFINLAKSGSTLRSFGDAFAIAISIGLQYGVPLSEFIDAFEHMRFEPSGFVRGHDSIKTCSSILDAVFKDLKYAYGTVTGSKEGDTELANEIIQNWTTDSAPSGDFCPECDGPMIRTGSCLTCQECGFNQGCG